MMNRASLSACSTAGVTNTETGFRPTLNQHVRCALPVFAEMEIKSTLTPEMPSALTKIVSIK